MPLIREGSSKFERRSEVTEKGSQWMRAVCDIDWRVQKEDSATVRNQWKITQQDHAERGG